MIRDLTSFETWLASRPAQTLRQDATVLAHRAALRFFPLWSGDLGRGTPGAVDRKCLKVARVHLCLSVALREPTEEALAALKRACEADRRIVATRAGAVAFAEASDKIVSASMLALESYKKMADRHIPGGSADLWTSVAVDVAELEQSGEIQALPLWVAVPPDWFFQRHQSATAHWRSEPQTWDFWLRWWEGVLLGRTLDLGLQGRVALLANSVWQMGPKAVAGAIARLQGHDGKPADDGERDRSSPDGIDVERVGVVRVAMERNRQALPSTFDAIEGLILIEIERLQGRNVRDHEWDHQMRVFLALHEAVSGLRQNLPAAGPVTDQNAIESERLIRLYLRKFGALPREKADEVVNGVVQVGIGAIKIGLIGATSLLAVSYGLPALAGVTIGSMVFAPKNSADLIKAAREAILPPKGGG